MDRIIIRGTEGVSRFTITESITQWDYGYYFIPVIEGLPGVYRVDFSNDPEKGEALPVYGDENGAQVPTKLIETGEDIYAFCFITGNGWGRTERAWKIPNKLKPKTAEEEPTPTQQGIVDQAIAQLNAAVEKTSQDVLATTTNAAEAQRHANEADQSAQDAEGSKTAAETAKNAAETARANARTSETNAALSASAAEQAKQAAQSYAEQANGSAETSILSADRAEQAANNAGYMDVDVVNGRLVYTRTDAVDTDLSLVNGRLIMRAI